MKAVETGALDAAHGGTTTQRQRGVLFVTQISTAGDSGPVATWIVIAGWAAAAARRYGAAWILTPEGVFTPEEALAHASRPALLPRSPRWWRPYVPVAVEAAVKDVRRLRRSRVFRSAAAREQGRPWAGHEVVAVWQHHDLFHDAGRTIARHLGCPVVECVEALSVWEARRWGTRRLGWGRWLERVAERPQLQSADLVICVSEEVAAAVQSLSGRGEGVVVTPNGVDIDRFRPGAGRDEVRNRHGLAGKVVVGWVGSFRPFHGLDLLLAAFARLQVLRRDAALLLVGDGQERRRVEALVAEKGLRNVVFIGTVPYERMPGHISAMDVAALLDEGTRAFHYSPLKLREYMACGVPVVASRVGEVDRLIADGVDGLLVERGDAEASARAVLRLIEDEPLRRSMGEAARTRAEWELSWDAVVARVDQALAPTMGRLS